MNPPRLQPGMVRAHPARPRRPSLHRDGASTHRSRPSGQNRRDPASAGTAGRLGLTRVQTTNGRGPLGYRVHSVAPGVITPSSVVLTGIPSHPRDGLLRLAERGGRIRQRSEAGALRQTQVRLSPDDIDHLVAAYQAGCRTTQLAAVFGVHRNTVQRLLRARGVHLALGPRA